MISLWLHLDALFRGFLLFEPLLPLRVEADIPLTKGLGHHNTGLRYRRTRFPACERVLLSIIIQILSIGIMEIICFNRLNHCRTTRTSQRALGHGCLREFEPAFVWLYGSVSVQELPHHKPLLCPLYLPTGPWSGQTRKSENVAQGIHSCNIFMQDCWSGVRCGLSDPMCPSSRPA